MIVVHTYIVNHSTYIHCKYSKILNKNYITISNQYMKTSNNLNHGPLRSKLDVGAQ